MVAVAKSYKPRFGYKPNPALSFRFNRTLRIPHISTHAPHLLETNKDQRDVFLFLDLLRVDPSWRRYAQEIGDCVSWGWTLGYDTVLAGKVVRGESEWPGAWMFQPATYGFRAQLDPRNFANDEDGWYGSGAAEAAIKCGFVPSLDWSTTTGNAEHDCRKYSGEVAKKWGRYGCGGKNDEGKLDAIAKRYLAREVSLITTLESSEAIIDRGAGLPICSDVGFGQMQRDEDGIVGISGSWPHCMVVLAKMYLKGKRLWRIFQSWGDSCSGPDPVVEDLITKLFKMMADAWKWAKKKVMAMAKAVSNVISNCSWWVTDQSLLRILKQQDSYGISGAEGFNQPLWDWEKNII